MLLETHFHAGTINVKRGERILLHLLCYLDIMQQSQRKRSAPSWLKEKPYIKIRFTQDGFISKVTESWKLKLAEDGQTLKGSLANYSFWIGQTVWSYRKTADEKEKAYFEGEVIEMWDNSTVVQENLPKEVDEVVEGKLSLKKFHTSACRDREQSTFAKCTPSMVLK